MYIYSHCHCVKRYEKLCLADNVAHLWGQCSMQVVADYAIFTRLTALNDFFITLVWEVLVICLLIHFQCLYMWHHKFLGVLTNLSKINMSSSCQERWRKMSNHFQGELASCTLPHIPSPLMCTYNLSSDILWIFGYALLFFGMPHLSLFFGYIMVCKFWAFVFCYALINW